MQGTQKDTKTKGIVAMAYGNPFALPPINF